MEFVMYVLICLLSLGGNNLIYIYIYSKVNNKEEVNGFC